MSEINCALGALSMVALAVLASFICLALEARRVRNSRRIHESSTFQQGSVSSL